MSTPQRPPFDVADAGIAAAYMRERNLTIIDPFTEPRATEDVILTTSLSTTRFLMAQSFGAARLNGQTYRAYPFIVGKPTANAFALEREGLQLCGLDIGLGTAAFEISLFVFSQASLFMEVGNPAVEVSPSLPTGSQLAFRISDRLRERGLADGPPVGIELIPKDPQRQLAAYFLTQLMLRFVWLHEHYHCLNGHTGFLASQRQGVVLNECPTKPRWD